MKYQEGACTWEDLVDNDESIHRNNFLIRRHALQILIPVDEGGELKCYNKSIDDDKQYPRLDVSKGFPQYFHLAHTEISVPSQHTQEGKRYDAEVSLAHFYSVDFLPNNQVRMSRFFMNKFINILTQKHRSAWKSQRLPRNQQRNRPMAFPRQTHLPMA